MKCRITIFFLILTGFFANGQPGLSYSSSEVLQGIKKLNTVGSVLYIAAHPDDENTRLLAYLSKEMNLRTGYLSLTRGDGGQNLIGNEQSELLGLIRTQELLAARRVDGAEQFFTRAIDFGFSKNPEETFTIWDKDQTLADAVWVIRKFRPDIIITRFPEDARAGHGQHSASAIIAREAFLAAGDPKRFPAQLSKVSIWQPLRLVWNTANFGGTNTTGSDQIKMDVGKFNPLTGKSYGEIAAESRTNHKSQGFGTAMQRGRVIEYFSHVAGKAATANIFEGLDLTWGRLDGGPAIGKMITSLDQKFEADDPPASVPALVEILSAVEKLKDPYWKTQKSREIKDLIAAAAGLWFESISSRPVYALGDSIAVTSHAVLRSDANFRLKAIGDSGQEKALEKDLPVESSSKLPAVKITGPYWLHDKYTAGMYSTPSDDLVGSPESTNVPAVRFVFNIGGKDISYDTPVRYKFTDQVRGEIYQLLVIAPPVTISPAEKAYVFSGNETRDVAVTLKSFRNDVQGTLIPKLPQGWKAEPERSDFRLAKNGEEKVVKFRLKPTENAAGGTLSFQADLNGQAYNRGYRFISYDHIPVQSLFPVAESRLEKADLITKGKRIGYIPGAGDLIPGALEQIGYQVTILTEAQVMATDLSGFDAIIAGVRLYNVSDQLDRIQPRLMDYVKNGGTYLVQYNVSNPLRIQDIGPYPFRISRDRVTDENAEVRFLIRDHPVLNYPNKISSKDFDGWVQERGLYFTSGASPEYDRVLSMNDPGEKPNDGALLVADYGKGRFVYTSLVFFRELPAGIPGAYRLFVNLITKNNSD